MKSTIESVNLPTVIHDSDSAIVVPSVTRLALIIGTLALSCIGMIDRASASQPPSFFVLYNFTGGNNAVGSLSSFIQGADGRLYGVSQGGGANGVGTVFAFNPDGTGYTTLHGFNGASDGSYPYGVIQGTDGRLYGTGARGGANSDGTVFAVNTDGTGFTTVYTFTGGSDGSNIAGAVIQGTDGRLYGTAYAGGSDGLGTVFAVNTDGTGFTVLHSFTGGNDGSQPYYIQHLVQGTDGRIYGSTDSGGIFGQGTLFVVNPDGTGFATLHEFTGGSDGSKPAGLVQGSDGRLYGLAAGGVQTVWGLRLP